MLYRKGKMALNRLNFKIWFMIIYVLVHKRLSQAKKLITSIYVLEKLTCLFKVNIYNQKKIAHT